MTCVFPFRSGKGFIEFEELRYSFAVLPGDVLFFRAHSLKHRAVDVIGERGSAVLVTHNKAWFFFIGCAMILFVARKLLMTL